MPEEKETKGPRKGKKVTLTQAKVCGKVVKYETDEEDALISNVYLSKKYADEMPESIELHVFTA